MKPLRTTDWLPSTVAPAHTGVYQRLLGDAIPTSGEPPDIYYSYWNGMEWHCGAFDVETARRQRRVSQYSLPWRGVLR